MERDLGNPHAVFNNSWSALRGQFHAVLDILENPAIREEGHIQDSLVRAQSDLLYRAAEFVDVLENAISKAVVKNPKKETVVGPSAIRKYLAMPCNKIKHEANFIILCECKSVGVTVRAYMIFHQKRDAMELSQLFHEDRDAFSFNVEIRKLFSSVYLFAAGYGEQLERLGSGQRTVVAPDAENLRLINRLVNLPMFAWPDETPKHMPSIKFSNRRLEIAEMGGALIPLPVSGATFVTRAKADGVTQKFGFTGRRHNSPGRK